MKIDGLIFPTSEIQRDDELFEHVPPSPAKPLRNSRIRAYDFETGIITTKVGTDHGYAGDTPVGLHAACESLQKCCKDELNERSQRNQ